MMTHRQWKATFGCALLAALLLTGCKETPTMASIQWEIERQIPGIRLEPESHVRLGRFTLAVVKKIVRLAGDEDDDDLRMISHVKRVAVATYRVRSLPAAESLDGPYRFDRQLAERGWEVVVRQREDDEQAWVFYRLDEDDSIRNLYVVTLDPYELVVVDLEGRLDQLLAEALADEPGELAELFGA